jgi:hypothetical protein
MARKVYDFDELKPEVQEHVLLNELDWILDEPSFYSKRLEELCLVCEFLKLNYHEKQAYMLDHGKDALIEQARCSQFYSDGELVCE